MAPTVRVVPSTLSLVLILLFASAGNAQQQPAPTKAVQLTGLVGVKDNTKGTLAVESGALRFVHSKTSSELAPGSMLDVVTGNDSQRVIGGTVGTMSMFAPYGSGRFLSLFRSKLDTLTIQYRDADGGLHGVIFTSPVGTAEATKDELVGLGARTSIPTRGAPVPDTTDHSDKKEPVEHAQGEKPAKINASAITVMMIGSDEVKLPAEFQISLYENLIQQLQKRGGFQHIYREGDRNSSAAEHLIVLHSTVRGFKQGSQMAREVTTVAGATSISVHCEFTDKDGQVLLARDISGKVRFFGGNLKATSDFAKKAANVAHQNVSPVAGT
jgi:hypothetical protein